MKLNRPRAGFALPLFPALLIGAIAATGSGRALMAGAALAGRGGAARLVEADTAISGLPFGSDGVRVAEDVSLHDGRRGRDVLVTVVYPRSGRGPFPVIVFSHGAGGDGNQNQPLTRYWASHGYVVLCPTHTDSLSFQRRQAEQAGGAGLAIPAEEPPADGNEGDGMPLPVGEQRASPRDARQWFDRAQDVSFLIDSLPDLTQRIPGLAGRVDSSRVGVGGEAWLGCATAQIVGGVACNAPWSTPAATRFGHDPRARAVLLLTMHGNDCLGLPDSLWPTIPRSLLAITGPDIASWKDTAAPPLPPGILSVRASRGQPHVHIRVERSFPLTFGGDGNLATGGAVAKDSFFSYVEDETLAFWDATLKGGVLPPGNLGEQAIVSARAHGVHATVESS